MKMEEGKRKGAEARVPKGIFFVIMSCVIFYICTKFRTFRMNLRWFLVGF